MSGRRVAIGAIAGALGAIAATLAGCGAAGDAEDGETAFESAAATSAGPSATASNIGEVLTTANRGEVAVAGLAIRRAHDPRVRAFAEQMAREHSLMAERAGEPPIQSTKVEPKSELARALQKDALGALVGLSFASDADFDRAYMDTQVKMHERVLQLIDQALGEPGGKGGAPAIAAAGAGAQGACIPMNAPKAKAKAAPGAPVDHDTLVAARAAIACHLAKARELRNVEARSHAIR